MIRKHDQAVARKELDAAAKNARETEPKPITTPTHTYSTRPHRQRPQKKRVHSNLPKETAPTRQAPTLPTIRAREDRNKDPVEVDMGWLHTQNSTKLRRLAELVLSAEYMKIKMDRAKQQKEYDAPVRLGKRTAPYHRDEEQETETKKQFLGENESDSESETHYLDLPRL